ncbi:thioesterase [Longibacter salinarum]|uniref:Acyl-coenzyme A thioesterase THEM4 n=1 Tax=Longibacter salinarum TaxID=1850348 RepID=A0A2A8CVI7_9BACT|nr:PaaI family thioesterase [Longibacter salinarum]PEN12604.1 thioesterase [Longibacter salinarum]
MPNILERLRERVPADADLQLPPPCYEEMEAEAVSFDAGAEVLVVRLPVQQRYQNPLGLMQGGFIAAAIDNTLGPLSFLVAPPSVTTQMSTQYLRPVPPSVDYIEVEGRVAERAGRQLFLEATVRLPNGKTAARAQATCQIRR